MDLPDSLDMFDPHTAQLVESFTADMEKLSGQDVSAYIKDRQQHYKAVFGDLNNPSVRFVLEDLAFFTRAHQSAFNADPRIHALIEGRREVYYRIKDNTQLPPDLLYDKYVAANLQRNQK